MARPIDTDHRRELLEAVTTHLLDHGLTNASLERMATAAGTSARMLVHHFGTRQALLDDALAIARTQEMAQAREHLVANADFENNLAGAWAWFSSTNARKYFRLFGQVAALGRLHDNAAPRQRELTTEWLELATDGFTVAGHDTVHAQLLATIFIAQVRGLLLDLDATEDQARIGAAYTHFTALLSLSTPQEGARSRRHPGAKTP